jgi:hypothetical protein
MRTETLLLFLEIEPYGEDCCDCHLVGQWVTLSSHACLFPNELKPCILKGCSRIVGGLVNKRKTTYTIMYKEVLQMGSASTYPNSTAGVSPPISLLRVVGIMKKID